MNLKKLLERLPNQVCKTQPELRSWESLIKKAIAKTPLENLPELYNRIAFFWANNKKPEKAVSFMTRAIGRQDKNPNYIANRSNYHFMSGRVDKALEDIGNAIRLKPEDDGFKDLKLLYARKIKLHGLPTGWETKFPKNQEMTVLDMEDNKKYTYSLHQETLSRWMNNIKHMQEFIKAIQNAKA